MRSYGYRAQSSRIWPTVAGSQSAGRGCSEDVRRKGTRGDFAVPSFPPTHTHTHPSSALCRAVTSPGLTSPPLPRPGQAPCLGSALCWRSPVLLLHPGSCLPPVALSVLGARAQGRQLWGRRGHSSPGRGSRGSSTGRTGRSGRSAPAQTAELGVGRGSVCVSACPCVNVCLLSLGVHI